MKSYLARKEKTMLTLTVTEDVKKKINIIFKETQAYYNKIVPILKEINTDGEATLLLIHMGMMLPVLFSAFTKSEEKAKYIVSIISYGTILGAIASGVKGKEIFKAAKSKESEQHINIAREMISTMKLEIEEKGEEK